MAETDRLRRAEHVGADGVNRADARLRSFGPREGDAVMCPRCGGGGWIAERAPAYSARVYGGKTMMLQPVKCPVCKGEGLDPEWIEEAST